MPNRKPLLDFGEKHVRQAHAHLEVVAVATESAYHTPILVWPCMRHAQTIRPAMSVQKHHKTDLQHVTKAQRLKTRLGPAKTFSRKSNLSTALSNLKHRYVTKRYTKIRTRNTCANQYRVPDRKISQASAWSGFTYKYKYIICDLFPA